MRILMLSRDDVYSVPGGDTIQMVQTKSELEKLGVQVELATINQAPDVEGFDLIHVFNWEQLESTINTYQNVLRNGLPMALSTIFWFHTGQWYDEALSRRPTWQLVNGVLGSSSSRRVYEGWQQTKFKWGERGRNLRKLLTVPSQLLPNSSMEIEHLEGVLGIRGRLQKRYTVIPNGVTKELFDPHPSPNQDFWREYRLEGFVVEVARIQAAKNQLGLIDALSDTTFPIVFIGQPSPYEKEYVSRCYEAGKRRGNVYFVSPKTPQELAGIYALAAVHVLPSWRETPGLVSLEAAAAGCRIVSTSIGSAREYFGDEAWYCDPRDPASIRRAVVNALNSPSSETLRSRILECFTWEVAAKKTLDAYHKVLN
jgi:glycosyltransferase involved in cell wall biosynthesis